MNHGRTTSIYYHDPDGNDIETQVENFEIVEKTNEFIRSPKFAENPIGTDFDPEELIKRLEAGEDEKIIKTRVEIGPRLLPIMNAEEKVIGQWTLFFFRALRKCRSPPRNSQVFSTISVYYTSLGSFHLAIV